MTELRIKSNKKVEFIDITRLIYRVLKESDVRSGICVVMVPHTTASITINENTDPTVMEDIATLASKIAPSLPELKHSEGNSPAHTLSSIFGSSVTILIENGKLMLGIWQGVFFCEFDGPRDRKVYLKIIEG